VFEVGSQGEESQGEESQGERWDASGGVEKTTLNCNSIYNKYFHLSK
jgi:hypothetical protein